MPIPAWLPPLIDVNPWTGNTFAALYQAFCADFVYTQLTLDGFAVRHFPDMEDGREIIFWHLTHRDDKATQTRLPDLPRCSRLAWVAAIIRNANRPEVTRWDFVESSGKTCTYLWVKDADFVVILRKFDNGSRRLITAYCIDAGGKRQSLESKYKHRIP